MVPGYGERISGDDARRPEQHIPGEPVICMVLGRKLPAHPMVHHADTLDSPVPIRRIHPAVCQVEPPRERHDVWHQTFDSHPLIPKVQCEGMFLPPRGAEHGVFAGDQNATDWQRVWGYGLEDLAPPNNSRNRRQARTPSRTRTSYSFGGISLRAWKKAVCRHSMSKIRVSHGGRRSTGEPFGNQPLSRVLGARQDRRLLHGACSVPA